MSVSPQVSNVSLGDTVELTCTVATEFSNNMFRWTHLIAEQAFPVGSNNPVLSVPINSAFDGAVYQCTVENAGQDTATINGEFHNMKCN